MAKNICSRSLGMHLEAFNEPTEFFGGVGVDGVYLHFHKANEFLGIEPLPTFICNNVMKAPNVLQFIADYQAHLRQVFA